MKQLLKENSKWKNVGWFFRILFMIFALTPGCLTTLSDGIGRSACGNGFSDHGCGSSMLDHEG